uniref:Uncharacterized protein n=1 Tax=Panagrolaimus superbus TaxID=310955 RepID=A0A914ZGD6_9BILA
MKVWVGPLLNHMWHSVKAANGDGDQCIQFMMTSLIHSLGVHEWQPGRLEDVLREAHSKFVLNRIEKAKYKKNNPSLIESKFVKDFQMTLSQCPHSYRPPNIVEDNRLPVYSKVYNVILKTLTKEHTIKDMMKVSPNLTTSALENLHSLITGKYRPKEVY